MRHKNIESCPGVNSLGTSPPMGLGISYHRRAGLGFPSENNGDPLDPNEFGHLLIGMAGGDAQR